MDTSELASRAAALRALHHGDRMLVLPNAWDVASARAVETAGFPVVATSSGAVSATLGYADGEAMPAGDAFAAVARMARAVGVPVTADIEAGYGLEPGEVVRRLLEAGAVGCNLEDTDHRAGGLVPPERHAALVAAVKEHGRAAGVDVVVNARVDVFIRSAEPPAALFDDGVERAEAYLAAGADCVYPIGLADEALIARFVEAVAAPVNIIVRTGAPSLARLAELGVARASLAGGLFREVMTLLGERLDGIAADAAGATRQSPADGVP